MSLELTFLIIIAIPLPFMYVQILKKAEAYGTIARGTMASAILVVLLFGALYYTGVDISDLIDKSITAATKIVVGNSQAMEALGLSKLSNAEATKAVKALYDNAVMTIPSVLLIFASIVAYIEYNILVRLRYRKIKEIKPLAYIRDFRLKNQDVMGWFIIYLGSYLLKFAGLSAGNMAVVNINVLVETILSLQGMSFIFFMFYIKRVPKVAPVLVSIALWIIPIGQTVLFVLGAFDLVFNYRRRFQPAEAKPEEPKEPKE